MVTVGIGTQGLAQSCAPSLQMAAGCDCALHVPVVDTSVSNGSDFRVILMQPSASEDWMAAFCWSNDAVPEA